MAIIIDGTNTPTLGGVGYGDGTELAFTGAGTSGQVLTSAGAGAPTWATPATSGLVFISSQTVTTAFPGVASVDFTSGISSTYDNYQIVFSNFRVSAGAARIRMRLYSAGAWATPYVNIVLYGNSGGVVGTDINSNSGTLGSLNAGTPDANTVWSGTLTLGGVNTSTSYASTVNGVVIGAGNTGASSTITTMGGTMVASGTVTGFQLYFSTGSVWFGTVSLYGMAKS